MDETELKRKLRIFLDDKLYTFIKTKNGRFYNGYVLSIDKNHFDFNDDKLGSIPIIFLEVEHIEPSRRKNDR